MESYVTVSVNSPAPSLPAPNSPGGNSGPGCPIPSAVARGIRTALHNMAAPSMSTEWGGQFQKKLGNAQKEH